MKISLRVRLGISGVSLCGCQPRMSHRMLNKGQLQEWNMEVGRGGQEHLLSLCSLENVLNPQVSGKFIKHIRD